MEDLRLPLRRPARRRTGRGARARARAGGDFASPDPEASARANIEELLNAFGEAQGSEVCSFFSDDLIEERAGLKSCQQYFEGKPALDSEIVKLSVTVPVYKEDVLPAASAVIKSGVSGQNLSLQMNIQGSVSDPYGGWIITSQSD